MPLFQVVFARFDISLGAFDIRLFDEGRDLRRRPLDGQLGAAPYIAVAGFRPIGGDAEGDELAGRRSRDSDIERGAEGRRIGDRMNRTA